MKIRFTKYPNIHRHIADIGVYTYLRGSKFGHKEEIGRKSKLSKQPNVDFFDHLLTFARIRASVASH